MLLFYRIQIIELESKTQRFVLKRYSEFYDLKEQLEKIYPDTKLFSFPPKVFGNNMTPRVIDERRDKLEIYLRECLADTSIRASQLLTSFLTPK